MTTYFARHTKKIDIDDETRIKLFRERWIAIHYPCDKEERQPNDPGNSCGGKDNISWNPEDYERRAQRPLRALIELAASGGYVCATYEGFDNCLIGYVTPNSPLELVPGKRGNHNGLDGAPAFLKGVRFQSARELDPRLHPAIFVGAPQQTTLTKWPCVKSRIEDLVEAHEVIPSFHSLTSAELETLCAEFIRTAYAKDLGLPVMTMLLLPVGRTMKDIDIYGIAEDGKVICAQVTYGINKSSQRSKEIKLRGYGDANKHLVIFGSYDAVTTDDGIICCPISTVYEYFSMTPDGKYWINFAR